MVWIPIGAWIAAVLIGAVVLTFAVYEITWKTRRLRSNLERMQDVAVLAADLQQRVTAISARATGLRS